MRILFVCMGNICRSPVVEAVARQRFARAGLDIAVDSAGTAAYHIGARPDARALASALAHGYDASTHRGREVIAADFRNFDALLVMDRINHRALADYFSPEQMRRVDLFLPFANIGKPVEVPDPYSGSARDFERVIELAELGVDGLIAKFKHP
ncbi:MAG: low molecular weight protein-tyrosine-phosphatase [Rudaea sp.]